MLRVGEIEVMLSSSEPQKKRPSKHQCTKDLHNVNTVQIMNVPNVSEQYVKLVLEKEAHGKLDYMKVYPERSIIIAKFSSSEGIYNSFLG